MYNGRPTTVIRRTCAGRCELGGAIDLAKVFGPHQPDAAVDREADDDGQVGDGAADGDDNRLQHVVVG